MAIDKSNFDESALPGDDFYQYSNGGWMKLHPLPGEFSRYGSFDILAEENQANLLRLIEEASEMQEGEEGIGYKAGLFFRTGMDTVKIDAQGTEPLADIFELIKLADNFDDLFKVVAHEHERGNSLLFHTFGMPDSKNSEMVIANIYQGGLGLTDVDYYRNQDNRSKSIREKYAEYIATMLKMTGVAEEKAKQDAETILSIETSLAAASLTRLERRDPYKTYHKVKVSELMALTPELNWENYFESFGLAGLEELNLGMPDFFVELNRLSQSISMDEWKVYFGWHTLNRAAPYLSSEYSEMHFSFYGAYLSGKQVNQPRWKRVLQAEDQALGEAIGQMYVSKYFPPESKERMLNLVENLRSSLAGRIQQLEWMSDSTKKEALDKLALMRVKIGYPDKWRDYSQLEVMDDSYYGNVTRAARNNHRWMIAKIGKPVDKDEWGMTPQTVNAYYSPTRNEIVFPAGILQPPFFYPEADDAVNYGAIGVVIGHEMTHGFDDQGRQYDKLGNLRDWWTREDETRFNERTQVLIDQFMLFEVLPGVNADGKLTLGENIADLGGLTVAWEAMQVAHQIRKPQRKINGFSPEQRFFLAYSHVWAQNITEKEILRRTKEDVHSLGRFRVNGPLPHLEPFYKAFGLNESAGMYIPVEKRAVIW